LTNLTNCNIAVMKNTKKSDEYAIARKCVKEFVETRHSFSLYSIEQYIKKNGGVLRTSTGVSVKEYLDDMVERGTLKRTTYNRPISQADADLRLKNVRKKPRTSDDYEQDYMYEVLPKKKEEQPCPVCKSNDTQPMYEYPDPMSMPVGGRVSGHYVHHWCQDCGVLFKPVTKKIKGGK
jgi:hypothetical protein